LNPLRNSGLGVERLEDRRLLAAGTLDTSWDGDGVMVGNFGTALNDELNAVAVQSDGKIVVAGTSDKKFVVARFLQNGTLELRM
jgi:hypothetical protein